MRMNEKIRYQRVRLGKTQDDVANQIGVSIEQFDQWEQGTATPSLSLLTALAKQLQVSTDWLLNENAAPSFQAPAPAATAGRVAEEPPKKFQIKWLFKYSKIFFIGFIMFLLGILLPNAGALLSLVGLGDLIDTLSNLGDSSPLSAIVEMIPTLVPALIACGLLIAGAAVALTVLYVRKEKKKNEELM